MLFDDAGGDDEPLTLLNAMSLVVRLVRYQGCAGFLFQVEWGIGHLGTLECYKCPIVLKINA